MQFWQPHCHFGIFVHSKNFLGIRKNDTHFKLGQDYKESEAKHSSQALVVFVQWLKMGTAWHYCGERQFLCYWLAPVVFLGWHYLNLSIVECKPLNLWSDFVAAAQSLLCLCNPTKMITITFLVNVSLRSSKVPVSLPRPGSFSQKVIINNLLFIFGDHSFKKGSFALHLRSISQRPIKLLLVPKTPQTVFDARIWHIYLLCNVLCRTMPIIINEGLYLLIIDLQWTPGARAPLLSKENLQNGHWHCRSIKASSPYATHNFLLAREASTPFQKENVEEMLARSLWLPIGFNCLLLAYYLLRCQWNFNTDCTRTYSKTWTNYLLVVENPQLLLLANPKFERLVG